MKHKETPEPMTREYLALQVKFLRDDGWTNNHVRRIMYETHSSYRAYLWHVQPNPTKSFLVALEAELERLEHLEGRLTTLEGLI